MTTADRPPSHPGGPGSPKPGFAGRFLWWFVATAILAAGLVLGAAALVAAGVILTVLWIYVLARGAIELRRLGQQSRKGPAVLDGEYVVVDSRSPGHEPRGRARGR